MIFFSETSDHEGECEYGSFDSARLLQMTVPELYRIPESELPFRIVGNVSRRYKESDLEAYTNANSDEYYARLKSNIRGMLEG